MKGWMLVWLLLLPLCGKGQIISTIAGTDSAGYSGDGGPALQARFDFLIEVAVDRIGNVYVADRNHNVVRKIDTFGIVTTLAGTGTMGFSGDNGPADSAMLNYPTGIAVDSTGNVFIADGSNHRIRKVDTAGIITTIAGTGQAGNFGDGGAAVNAHLNFPGGICFDNKGNLIVATVFSNKVRRIDHNGIIQTIAGIGPSGFSGDGGPATNAQFKQPRDVWVDKHGNLFIADYGNDRVRKVDTFGIITTFAGSGSANQQNTTFIGEGGPATDAWLNGPTSVAADPFGNVYISGGNNAGIRRVDTAGVIITYAGTGAIGFGGDGGPPNQAKVGSSAVATDQYGNLYIADIGNHRVRKVTMPPRTPAAITGQQAPVSIVVFPNPATGSFTVSGSVPQSWVGKPVTIEVMDMEGRVVLHRKAFVGSANSWQHHVILSEGCAPGLYLLHVKGPDGSAVIPVQLTR